MPDNDDMLLLRQYARENSEAAFATLVSRYLDLVYSAALRKTENPHAAEEIAQAVFVILAQKAGFIPAQVILAGWLYQTTRLTALSYLKRESRRVRREQEAYMQAALPPEDPDQAWEKLAPLLEDAMGELAEKDRAAVVLRYFSGKSFSEVATATGVTENAAKKRVGSALDKLHRYFTRRGVRSTTTLLATVLAAHSVQAAPVTLAASVTAVAAAKGVAAGGATLTLIEGALKLMAWTKAKIAAVASAAVLLTAGTTMVVVNSYQSPRNQPDLRGAWSGVVQTATGGKLRVVFNVTRDNGKYQATLASIDQRTNGIPVAKLRYKFPAVSFHMPEIQGDFEGTFNTNTHLLSGTWKQMGATTPLRLKLTATPPEIPQRLVESDYTPRAGSDLQGYWTGVLKPGNNTLRLALKVAEREDGQFLAELDSPDQGVTGIVVTQVEYEKPLVRFEVGAVAGNFDGELSGDGKTIAGEWSQSRGAMPLELKLTDPAAERAQEQAREAQKNFASTSPDDLAGHWLGTLDIKGIKLRLALHLARLPDGKWAGTLDSLDQGAKGIVTDTIQWAAPAAHLEWKSIGGSYDGTLQKGKLMGTWRQGGQEFPLNFDRTKN